MSQKTDTAGLAVLWLAAETIRRNVDGAGDGGLVGASDSMRAAVEALPPSEVDRAQRLAGRMIEAATELLLAEVKATHCTGVLAVWCPVCGDCTCPRDEDGHRDDESSECPLHGFDSTHGSEVQ